MNNIFFIISKINAIYLSIVFIFAIYFDLKYRKLSNKLFKLTYFFSLLMIIIESFFYFENGLYFIILKLNFLIIAFLLTFMLFMLKIIGGSDGKLIILIFFSHPINNLNYHFANNFFLLFSLFFILYFILNLFSNNFFKVNYSFVVFFSSSRKISRFKKFYIKMFYKFINYSELSDLRREKYQIKFYLLIYNNRIKKIQILSQFRPPLILIIAISYYILIYLKVVF